MDVKEAAAALVNIVHLPSQRQEISSTTAGRDEAGVFLKRPSRKTLPAMAPTSRGRHADASEMMKLALLPRAGFGGRPRETFWSLRRFVCAASYGLVCYAPLLRGSAAPIPPH